MFYSTVYSDELATPSFGVSFDGSLSLELPLEPSTISSHILNSSLLYIKK